MEEDKIDVNGHNNYNMRAAGTKSKEQEKSYDRIHLCPKGSRI